MPSVNLKILLIFLFSIVPHASHAAEIFYCIGTTDIFEGNKKINSIDDFRSYDVDAFNPSSTCKPLGKITVCKFTMESFDEIDNKKYLVITKLRFNAFTRRISESTYMQRDNSLTAATFNGVCELVTIDFDS